MSNLELGRSTGWLSREELDFAREKLPILYVDAVPVRVDDRGAVTTVGVLLRLGEDGGVCRELVSGRVLHHERVRDALLRHIEKDLGPMALPRVPASPQPFTVAEYFPTPGVTPVPRPAPARRLPGVRRAGRRRLRAAERRARPDLAHPRPGARPAASRPRWSAATGCCCARRWPTSATPSDSSRHGDGSAPRGSRHAAGGRAHEAPNPRHPTSVPLGHHRGTQTTGGTPWRGS